MGNRKEDLFDANKVRDGVVDILDVINAKFEKNQVGFAHAYCALVDVAKSMVTTQALIECLRDEDMTEDEFLNSVTKMAWLVGTRIMNIDEDERSKILEARKEWLEKYKDLKNED